MKAHSLRMAAIGILFFCISCLHYTNIAEATSLCTSWNFPKTMGFLDAKELPEASGLAVSKIQPDRLYHINDSGNEFSLILTDLNGQTTQIVKLKGMVAKDTEELALGPCGTKSCLFIGDIGDNGFQRQSIQLGWLAEKATYSTSENLDGKVTLTYPDGSHNAESMIVHPDGDLYIFSKGRKVTGGKPTEASQIYKISVEKILQSQGQKLQLEKLGELDLPELLPQEKPENQIATSATINAAGGRLLILTYKNILEFQWDAVRSFKKNLREGVDFQIIHTTTLPQQEAISFMPNSSFLVTSESIHGDAPLLHFTCEE